MDGCVAPNLSRHARQNSSLRASSAPGGRSAAELEPLGRILGGSAGRLHDAVHETWAPTMIFRMCPLLLLPLDEWTEADPIGHYFASLTSHVSGLLVLAQRYEL